MVRFALLGANLLLLTGIVVFVLRSNPSASQPILSGAKAGNSELANPLDTLSSADIAATVSRMTALPESTAVVNMADSVDAQLGVDASGTQLAEKPQVFDTALKSRKDIRTYVTKEGDTMSVLANKFGITSDTIRWSNDLTGEKLLAGKELVVSPVNGIAYKVKPGDTPEGLAQRFRADKSRIITFNDAEINGLPVNEYIVIPDGTIIAATRSASSLSAKFSWGGNAPIYGSNGYDYGFCTWWVAVRRAQIGRPVPSNLGNAVSWKALAPRAGLGVGNTPAAGAVIWTDPAKMSGYYRSFGHVGFVEKVNPDGSIWVSDMNSSGYTSMDTNSSRGGGWGRTSYRLLSAAQAATFSYIY